MASADPIDQTQKTCPLPRLLGEEHEAHGTSLQRKRDASEKPAVSWALSIFQIFVACILII